METQAKELLTARETGALLGISWRQVYRLADSGRMPAALKLGGATRWRRATIIEWLDRGCPPVRRLTEKLAR